MRVQNISKTNFGLKPLRINTQNKVIDFVRNGNGKVLSYTVRDTENRLLKEYSRTQKDNITSIVIDEYQYNHGFASIKDIKKIEITRNNDGKFISISNTTINGPSKKTDIYLNSSGSLNKAYSEGKNPRDNFMIKSVGGKLLKIFGYESF